MGTIVKTTDFTGKYAISQNPHTVTNLQSFIDKYEKVYLRDLLGLVLGDLFYADIATGTFLPPVNPIYSVLFNPIAVELNGREVISNGVKEMLLGFIYWEYTRKQPVVNTVTGNVIQANETSVPAGWNESDIYEVYNEAVKTYSAIQYFINDDRTNYPTYNGKCKQLNSWFL